MLELYPVVFMSIDHNVVCRPWISEKTHKYQQCVVLFLCTTVKWLKLVVAQFLWYSLLALDHEITSSTKINHKRFWFPTETEYPCIHEIYTPWISKQKILSLKIGSTKLNESRVIRINKCFEIIIIMSDGLVFLNFRETHYLFLWISQLFLFRLVSKQSFENLDCYSYNKIKDNIAEVYHSYRNDEIQMNVIC